MLNKKLLCLSLLLALMAGCSSIPTPKSTQGQSMSSQQRSQLVKQINRWQITGKIAFIEQANGKSPAHKQSANLFWQVDEPAQQQQLNLTTFLGINVFNLSSDHGLHQIKVDGKTYQSRNLHQLIYGLSHYALPTTALSYWLKGIKYHAADQISYAPQTNLPTQLISMVDGQIWQISYGDYQWQDGFALAHRLIIKTATMTIKLQIKQWQITL